MATDAPLLPHQCERIAKRAAIGVARVGGYASHGSARHLRRVRDREPEPFRDGPGDR